MSWLSSHATWEATMKSSRAWLLAAVFLLGPTPAAYANVITDWDEKAVAFVQSRMVPPLAYRVMAIVHVSMFDAVNSIEPIYRPYKVQLPATARSEEHTSELQS